MEQGTPIIPDSMLEESDDPRIEEPIVVKEGEVKPKDDEPEAPGEGTPTDEPEEVEEVSAEDLVTVDDPGEYQPKDYSFQVTTYDSEGKNGRSVTVKSVEQWDELIDTLERSGGNLGSTTSVLRAERAASRMERNLETDRVKWQSDKDAYDQQLEANNQRIESTNQMIAEMNYLVERGDLPRVAQGYINADWSDPEVAKQAGVKEQVEVLNYMRRENAARTRAGLKPMTSVIDAFNAFQLDQTRKGTVAARQRAGQSRREAGARVAASTPNTGIQAPKGISVGRGGNLRDLANVGW